MRKVILGVTAVITLELIVWASGDPWKSKPYQQWTEQDVAQVLQISPWAKPNLRVQGAAQSNGMTQITGGSVGYAGSSSDTSHVSAGATPDRPGGSEKSDLAAAAQATYSIFWWSSRTIREASLRRAVLKGTMTEADAEKDLAAAPDDYMILVQGTNMSIFEHRGEQAFEKTAFIQLKKSKQKAFPTKVAFLKGVDGQTVTGAIFYFAKTQSNGEPTISPDEKEVDFYLQLGEHKLLTYFDPRKMVDSKGEDL
jgi:hypothetical protein